MLLLFYLLWEKKSLNSLLFKLRIHKQNIYFLASTKFYMWSCFCQHMVTKRQRKTHCSTSTLTSQLIVVELRITVFAHWRLVSLSLAVELVSDSQTFSQHFCEQSSALWNNNKNVICEWAKNLEREKREIDREREKMSGSEFNESKYLVIRILVQCL